MVQSVAVDDDAQTCMVFCLLCAFLIIMEWSDSGGEPELEQALTLILMCVCVCVRVRVCVCVSSAVMFSPARAFAW